MLVASFGPILMPVAFCMSLTLFGENFLPILFSVTFPLSSTHFGGSTSTFRPFCSSLLHFDGVFLASCGKYNYPILFPLLFASHPCIRGALYLQFIICAELVIHSLEALEACHLETFRHVLL